MEYYSVMQNKEIMLFATTWMDLEIIILSEVLIRQKGKDKCHINTGVPNPQAIDWSVAC